MPDGKGARGQRERGRRFAHFADIGRLVLSARPA